MKEEHPDNKIVDELCNKAIDKEKTMTAEQELYKRAREVAKMFGRDFDKDMKEAGIRQDEEMKQWFSDSVDNPRGYQETIDSRKSLSDALHNLAAITAMLDSSYTDEFDAVGYVGVFEDLVDKAQQALDYVNKVVTTHES